MDIITPEPLVRTIKEKCRLCYSCVRECPAKAIRIAGGQAGVLSDRCIGCGNCVRVCTQNAKKVRDSIPPVGELLSSGKRVAAVIAPSFPAEFSDIDPQRVVGMIRKLGFSHVVEVAFGADLVSRRYREIIEENNGNQYIATSCPAVVLYVEKYHPGLVKNLAPIASPMVACARAVHRIHGEDIDVVFIGPCLAKKEEARRTDVRDDVAEVLTFTELRDMLDAHGITPDGVEPSSFDKPNPGMGAIYPIGRGMLQASELKEDLMSTDVLATDGTKQFVSALREFEEENHSVRLLELLCCNGCIMGSGMTTRSPQFTRRARISSYAKKRNEQLDRDEWSRDMEAMKVLDLAVRFEINDQRLPAPTREELQKILQRKGKFNPEDELNCGACGYDTCIEHAIAIYRGLAESEMCLPYAIETLKKTAEELSVSYEQLMNTKNALVQSEKLASLGRLAAGIAHEVNNPLTGVLTFSSILSEELAHTEYAEDLQTIVNETLRCRQIVRGILDFARITKLEKEPANINGVIIDALAILEKHVNFQNIAITPSLAQDIPVINMDVIQMRSVINNFCMNAADAMPQGGALTITTQYHRDSDVVKVAITDTGTGIRNEDLEKIFDPFFTTKKTGMGTGLGLSVTYGIIERHKGTIDVESTVGEGTTFTITLPVDQAENEKN